MFFILEYVVRDVLSFLNNASRALSENPQLGQKGRRFVQSPLESPILTEFFAPASARLPFIQSKQGVRLN